MPPSSSLYHRLHSFVPFLLEIQTGDQIVEVNGVDFTNVDHKEVKFSLLDTILAFLCLFNTSRKERTFSLSLLPFFLCFNVFILLFSGCEGSKEQQESDYYCADRSSKCKENPLGYNLKLNEVYISEIRNGRVTI